MRYVLLLAIAPCLSLVAGCDLLKQAESDKKEAPAAPSPAPPPATPTGAAPAAANTATAKPADSAGAPAETCDWPTDNVTKDLTFKKGCAVTAKRNLHVDEGATVTFEEGVKVSFDTDVYFWVDYGKLLVKGTEKDPVVFTSLNKSPGPGDWVGIGFKEKTMSGTSLDHLVIEYTGSKSAGGQGAIKVEEMRQGGRISITNSTIRSSSQFGLLAENNASFARFEGNTFKDNKLGSVRVVPEVAGSFGKGNTFSQPIHISNGKVDETTTWPAFDVPVIVEEGIVVASDSSVPVLTIADKTVVKMAQGAWMDIGRDGAGALVAKNVTFTSAAPAPAAADWIGIVLRAKTNGTVIDGCSFEDFGNDARGGKGAITLMGANSKDLHGVTIANNTFKDGKFAAIHSDDKDCSPFANNKADGIPVCNKD
jgi:hypothetical protein